MKNFFKLFGNLNRARRVKVPLLIITLMAVIGFGIIGCDNGTGGDDGGGGTPTTPTTYSLNGVWKNSIGSLISIVDSDGFIVKTNNSGWQEVIKRGNFNIGDKWYSNITSSGNRTWSCKLQSYNSSTYNLSSWIDGTIILAADGQSYTQNSDSSTTIWTKIADNGINGIWKNSIGSLISIVDSDGFIVKTNDSGWQEVIKRGNFNIGDKWYSNITSSGNRTWSCKLQTYNSSTYNLASWVDGTIILAADGQSFTQNSGSSTVTWTRR